MGSVAVATPSPSTPASTPKLMVGSLAGQVTPGTKVVLTTKMGAPVTFQQNKNFQQSFATWVKQGQTTQGTAPLKLPSLIWALRDLGYENFGQNILDFCLFY